MIWQILGWTTFGVDVLAGFCVATWLRSVWTEPLRRALKVPKLLSNDPITLDSDWTGFL